MTTRRDTPKDGRRPTLRDVAAASGVSVKTVSRVVNGEGGVSAELESRVTDAIRTLGYSPDTRARHLRSHSTTTGAIGLIQNDVSNPFFAAIFKGVEEVATNAGNVVLAASSGADQEQQDDIVRAFIERRVDGLIVVPAAGDLTLIEEETRRGTPVVFVDLMPSRVVGDVVLSDHVGGAMAATRHLIDHGHRRIAFLGDDVRFFSARERERGYREALESFGIEFDPAIARFDVGSPQMSATAVAEMLASPNPPTAFFTAQNFVSVGTVRVLKELGRSDDVAVVGFDDLELADVLDPPLSVVPQEPHELGRRAAELLYRRLDGYDGPPDVVVLPCGLLRRGSGEIPGR